MSTKSAAQKRKPSKQDREKQVLLGLVKHYLLTGKPVGSNTLKEAEFEDFSSATIRNYFANLEKEGFLEQQHASGGRVPTHAAYRLYAEENLEAADISAEHEVAFDKIAKTETREIADFLQKASETLSELTQTAVFISAPRFDHDYVASIKVVPIDATRCVCILISDFGVIRTETMHINGKMSLHTAHRIEAYFHWRLTGDQPVDMDDEEQELAETFYKELMLRYIVGYANFSDADLYRTGFSTLLQYPEFQETATLASSLSLFENAHSMRLLLRECSSKNALKVWIGGDLDTFSHETPDCTIIAHPYYINNQPVGAIGMLGPTRIPYKELFGAIKAFADSISRALTRNVYKFKITYRQPQPKMVEHFKEEYKLIGHKND